MGTRAIKTQHSTNLFPAPWDKPTTEGDLDTIAGGPLDVGYAHAKAALVLTRDFPPSFKTETAAKDAARSS